MRRGHLLGNRDLVQPKAKPAVRRHGNGGTPTTRSSPASSGVRRMSLRPRAWPYQPMMDAIVETAARWVALICDAATVLVIAWGALLALRRVALTWRGGLSAPPKREIWLHFAGWIGLALEFALAADICKTALSPTWNQIGQLAAIAAIRTALNLFLGRDMGALRQEQPEERAPLPS